MGQDFSILVTKHTQTSSGSPSSMFDWVFSRDTGQQREGLSLLKNMQHMDTLG